MSIRRNEPDDPQLSSIGTTPFDDFERFHAHKEFSVPAADMTGATGQKGEQFEAEEFFLSDLNVGRGEVAEIVAFYAQLNVFSNSTQTADGTVRARAGVGVDNPGPVSAVAEKNYTGLEGNIDTYAVTTDNASHLIMLSATGSSAFSDSATGLGGGGSTGTDEYDTNYRGEFGSGPTVTTDGKLEGDINLEAWNIDDAAIHADLTVEAIVDYHEGDFR